MTDEWALSKQLCFGKVAQRVLGNGRTDLPTDMIAFTDITRSTEEREKRPGKNGKSGGSVNLMLFAFSDNL